MVRVALASVLIMASLEKQAQKEGHGTTEAETGGLWVDFWPIAEVG